jgi:transcriptional regulator with XRE-family HTH domain
MLSADVKDLRKRLAMRRELPPAAECRRLRQAAGVSLREVADLIGVTPTAVHHWECNRRRISDEHLESYARFVRLLQEVGDAA